MTHLIAYFTARPDLGLETAKGMALFAKSILCRIFGLENKNELDSRLEPTGIFISLDRNSIEIRASTKELEGDPHVKRDDKGEIVEYPGLFSAALSLLDDFDTNGELSINITPEEGDDLSVYCGGLIIARVPEKIFNYLSNIDSLVPNGPGPAENISNFEDLTIEHIRFLAEKEEESLEGHNAPESVDYHEEEETIELWAGDE